MLPSVPVWVTRVSGSSSVAVNECPLKHHAQDWPLATTATGETALMEQQTLCMERARTPLIRCVAWATARQLSEPWKCKFSLFLGSSIPSDAHIPTSPKPHQPNFHLAIPDSHSTPCAFKTYVFYTHALDLRTHCRNGSATS